MSNSGKVLFNGFVSSKSKKSNNKNHRNIRKISREEIQQIKNQSVKKYDNKHRIFNISRNELRQNYRNNYNNTGNYRYNYIKNAGIINKSKNNQHNFNSSYSSSTSKVLFSNANSNSSSNYYNILDNYNFSDGLNVIKSVNLNGKNIKSITTSKSTVKLITLKDTTGCDLNFIFNIEGGPQGEQGPDGKSLTSVTYTLGQDVGTTSDVIFDTVEATNPSSYSLGGVSVTAAQWAHLVTMNQYVGTTADVIFNSVTATTSYTLGSTTIDATQWNRLATIDQDLSTTDNVTFNSVTATTSYSLGSTTIDAIVWNHLASIDQDLSTTDNVTFNSVTATTSYTLGSTIIDATTWNHLASINQDLSTTDNVTFNSVTATTSYSLGSTTINATTWNHLASIDQDLATTDDVNFNSVTIAAGQNLTLNSGQVYINSPSTTAIDFYTANINRMTISDDSFFPNISPYNLGRTISRFQTLYLGTSIDLGGTAIDATQWNRLATIDQDLATTDDVNFNSVTVANGERVNLLSTGEVYITSPSTTAMEFYTQNTLRATLSNTSYSPGGDNTQDLGASTRQWKTLYLGSTADLAGTPIGTTQWNYLAGVTAPFSDQSLNIADNVNFNSIEVPYNTTDETPTVRLGSANVGVYSTDNNDIRFTLGGNLKYIIDLTGFYPEDTNNVDLGNSSNSRYWKDFYLAQKANVGQLNISNPTVPGTTAAAGTAGDIAWDANYIYVCIATNSWKRALLSTW